MLMVSGGKKEWCDGGGRTIGVCQHPELYSKHVSGRPCCAAPPGVDVCAGLSAKLDAGTVGLCR